MNDPFPEEDFDPKKEEQEIEQMAKRLKFKEPTPKLTLSDRERDELIVKLGAKTTGLNILFDHVGLELTSINSILTTLINDLLNRRAMKEKD